MTAHQTIWSKYISARKARAVAKALNEAGYAITIEQVRDQGYALNIGNYLEPMDTPARERIYRVISEAAGFQPKQKEEMQ